MTKKLFLLIGVLLFAFNSSIHSSEQIDLLKNLSLFYLGAGVGLRVVGDKLYELSGAPKHRTWGKPAKTIYFDEYNTDSIIKKAMARMADSFLVTSDTVFITLLSAAWGLSLPFTAATFLANGIFEDVRKSLSLKRKYKTWGILDVIAFLIKNEDWETLRAITFLRKGASSGLIMSTPGVAAFGGPLLLQQLYKVIKNK
jgi:hypothetical protein